MRSNVLFILFFSILILSNAALAQQPKNTKSSVPDRASTFTDPTTGMEFILVKGGCYEMGDQFGDGFSDELPVHQVCVNDFYMGKYPVTQEQWMKIMADNPSKFAECGGKCPVDKVSWKDAQKFIYALNQKSGKNYRLPTEAEWEYAARSGGKKEKWAGTGTEAELGDFAWYAANSGKQTHPVGLKKPNGLGLYDMTGNVWEWMADWYDAAFYKNSPKDDPKGPASDIHRALRGGSWNNGPKDIRASDRYNHGPDRRDDDMGFRLVMTP